MDGDVYIDVDIPCIHFPAGSNPSEEEKLAALKEEMVATIRYEWRFRKHQNRRFQQKHFAYEVGLHQPEISDILRGRVERFSIERLMLVLIRCGCRPYIDWCGSWFESRRAPEQTQAAAP